MYSHSNQNGAGSVQSEVAVGLWYMFDIAGGGAHAVLALAVV
jgi:hypothetical protein